MPSTRLLHRVQPWSWVAALSLSLGLVSLPLITPAFAQEQRIRTLTVGGEGMVMIPTTLTQVQLGVEVQGKTAEEVQQEAARRTTSVIELLRSRNVDKLETTGIRLNPIYSYANEQQQLTGYSAINTVSFRLNTQKVGSLMDDAVKAGATRIDGISFVATDAEISKAQQQAIKLAIADAELQANAVLNALNLTRREIVGIQVNNASAPVPMPVMFKAENVAAPSTPVIGGEQQVQASVTLQISY